ncbi:trehalose-phosphatase [soil metagenome]
MAADEALCELLAQLSTKLDGALAVLTGRTVAEADRILRGAVACVGGLHGAQLRNSQRRMTSDLPRPADWSNARAAVERLIGSGEITANLEDKGGALALHYRHAPGHASSVRAAVQAIADAHDLRVLHGKMVSELLPFGDTKGTAVHTLMQGLPFAGRLPVTIGDDITDEDAFAAANEMNGVSVLVGAPRPTHARCNIPNVSAVRAWLSAAVAK